MQNDTLKKAAESIIKKLHEEYLEDIELGIVAPFDEWLLINCADLGRAFYKKLQDNYGINELNEEIN